MKLGKLDRTSAISWSTGQHPSILALGTVAGATDSSFSTQTLLEFYSVDATSNELFKKLNSINVNARFNILDWSSFGKQYGLLAGGKENGELDIYDPFNIIESSTADPVARHALFSGPVKGVNFSPVNPSILAAGGLDAEVLVFDLQSGATPFRPAPKSARIEDVTCLAWNNCVDYIFAVGSNNGVTAVYDIRGKREIMKFSYPNGRKQVTGVSWHPLIATKIITVNDDDNLPHVLTWDLRNSSSPEQSFGGHEKGILSCNWCPKDSDLLLTTSKDNRTMVWDLSEGSPVGELALSRNWTFDAKWCPTNPDLVAVASFDGTVSVHSLQGQLKSMNVSSPAQLPSALVLDPNDPFANIGNQYHYEQSSDVDFVLKKTPKWLRRSVGASWAFGGKLVSFSGKKVSIYTPDTEPNLKSRIKEMDQIMKSDSLEMYKVFCEKMSTFEGGFTNYDRETWLFLKVMFEKSREQMLEFLGFSLDSVIDEKLVKIQEKLNSINLESQKSKKATVKGSFSLYPPVSETTKATKVKDDNDIDTLITKYCIVGDFENAVNACLSANRLSDALVIAISGGPELLQKVQKEYFNRKSSEKSYIRLLQSVVDSDFEDIVTNANLYDSANGWKDIIAFVATFASSSELPNHFSNLGKRISESLSVTSQSPVRGSEGFENREKKKHAAALCFIGAGDMEKAVDVWTHREHEEENALLNQTLTSSRLNLHFNALQSLIEKVTVLRKAVNYIDPELTSTEPVNPYSLQILYEHMAEYAEVTSGLGEVDLAMKFLDLIPNGYTGSSENMCPVKALKDRVFHASGCSSSKIPSFPFETQEIISLEEIEAARAQENAKLMAAQQLPEKPQQPQNQNNMGYYNQPQNSSYYNQTNQQNSPYQNPQNNWNNPYNNSFQQSASQNSYAYNQNQPYNASVPPTANYINQQPQQNQQPWIPTVPPPSNPVLPPAQVSAARPFVPPTPFVPPVPRHNSSSNIFGAVPQYPNPPPPRNDSNFNPSNIGAPPNANFGVKQPPAQFGLPPPPQQFSGQTMPSGVAPPMTTKNGPQVSQPNNAPLVNEPAVPPKDIVTSSECIPIIEAFEKSLSHLKQNMEQANQKRVYEDIEKRVGILLNNLKKNEISDDVTPNLIEIATGIENEDYQKAIKAQVDLMTRKFDKTGLWIMGVKRLIDSLEKLKISLKPETPLAAGPPFSPSGYPPSPNTAAPPLMSGPPQMNMNNRQPMTGPPQMNMNGPPPLSGPPQMNFNNRQPMAGPPQIAPPPMAGPPQMNMNALPPMAGPPQMNMNAPPPMAGPPQMNNNAHPPMAGPPQMNMNAPPPMAGPPQMNMNAPPPMAGPPQMNMNAPPPTAGPPKMNVNAPPPMAGPPQPQMNMNAPPPMAPPPMAGPPKMNMNAPPPTAGPPQMNMNAPPPMSGPPQMNLNNRQPMAGPPQMNMNVPLPMTAPPQMNMNAPPQMNMNAPPPISGPPQMNINNRPSMGMNSPIPNSGLPQNTNSHPSTMNINSQNPMNMNNRPPMSSQPPLSGIHQTMNSQPYMPQMNMNRPPQMNNQQEANKMNAPPSMAGPQSPMNMPPMNLAGGYSQSIPGSPQMNMNRPPHMNNQQQQMNMNRPPHMNMMDSGMGNGGQAARPPWQPTRPNQ